MKLFVILFSISLLFGCANRRYAYSGKNEIEASSSNSEQSLDSIVNKYNESFSSSEETKNNMEIIFTTVEYSDPDSLGNQYKKKETTGTIKKESNVIKDSVKETLSEDVSISQSDRNSVSNTSQKTETLETSVKESAGLAKYIIPIIIIALAVLVYFLWPYIKKMIK